jgi:hypothetical protein
MAQLMRRSLGALVLGVLVLVCAGGIVLVSFAGPAADRFDQVVNLSRPAAQPPGVAALVLAGGSFEVPNVDGLVVSGFPSGRQLGHVGVGGPSQGNAMAVAPDGRRVYWLDRAPLPNFPWQLIELELPNLRELRRSVIPDGINLLGYERIVSVSANSAQVYVETMRIIGPQRFDAQLRLGQPDSEYSIAVYDVARGAFTQTISLEPPWCGVGELFSAADGRVVVLCPTSHQVRLVDPRAGKQVASVSVSGEMAALSPDRRLLWVVSRTGSIQEVDLSRAAVTRSEMNASCAGCVPLHRLHSSLDGNRLFVRAAPDRPELAYSGKGSVLWVIDTTSLRRVAEIRFPEPAFDAAPTPDGRAVLASTMRTDLPEDARATWLLDVPSGRELQRWPWSLCCLEIYPLTQN